MKRYYLSILMALLLVAVLAVPTGADDIDATVTVSESISITISDNGTEGLSWTDLDPGDAYIPEAASPNASVIIYAGAENNADVTIYISGTDFSNTGDTESFPIANAFWNDINDTGSSTSMSTSDATVATLSASENVSIYHWLSIPSGQKADTYTSTFSYTSSS